MKTLFRTLLLCKSLQQSTNRSKSFQQSASRSKKPSATSKSIKKFSTINKSIMKPLAIDKSIMKPSTTSIFSSIIFVLISADQRFAVIVFFKSVFTKLSTASILNSITDVMIFRRSLSVSTG